MIHHISKHVEVPQTFSIARRYDIFNSLIGVWTCGEHQLSVVLDKFLLILLSCYVYWHVRHIHKSIRKL